MSKVLSSLVESPGMEGLVGGWQGVMLGYQWSLIFPLVLYPPLKGVKNCLVWKQVRRPL